MIKQYLIFIILSIIFLIIIIIKTTLYLFTVIEEGGEINENFKSNDERSANIDIFLEKCAKKYNDENIKNIELNTEDKGNRDINKKMYSMTYNKKYPEFEKYCGPDWTFISWPSASINSFEETKNEIINESNKKPTIDKIGWFGNINSPMPDVIEYKTRPLLKKIGDENSDIFDIIHIAPNGGNGGIIDKNIQNYTSLPELIKYKYLLDIGGNGYSGRLKYLLYSKRPLIYIERDYIEYFNNDLKPFVHYIPVKEDLSDLLEQVKWMKEHEEESLKIAENAYNYAIENFTEDKILARVYEVYKNINN
jgi:hypothetical protein